MKLHFEKRILAAFLITVLVLIVLGLFSYTSTQRLIQTERLLTHASRVIIGADKIVNLAVDIETGQRGYVITGDTVFLEPFHEASRTMAGHLYSLDSLSNQNPEQKEQVRKLHDLVSRQAQWTWEVIEIRKKSFEESRDMVNTKIGKQLTDSIRAQGIVIQNQERMLFAKGNTISAANLRKFQYSFMGIAVAITMIVTYLFYHINAQLKARTQTEYQLKETAIKTRDLYDNAPCGYHSLNKDGIIEEMNHTELQWLGYTEEEVINKMSIFNLLTPQGAALFKEKFPQFKAQGYLKDLEVNFLRKDGTDFPTIISATALLDNEGNFLKSRSTIFDNTERKKAESALKKSMDTVRDLYDNAPCGYLSLNSELAIDDMNQTMLSWMGYTRNEVVGKMRYEDLLSRDAKIRWKTNFEERFETFKQMKFASDAESEYQRKDKSTFPVIVNSIAFFNEAGEFTQSRSSIIDNTERKKSETRILQLNQELEAFTYSVSHDLRAPLRSITGYAQILKEDYGPRLDEDANGIIDVVVRNAKRMGQLVDDLLDFAQLGRKGLAVSTVDMDELVHGIIQEARAHENGRKINFNVHPLPSAEVDFSMIRQVWTNLISNALKYSRKKEFANIEIGCYPAEGNEKICYFIRDNGAGFDMKYADKLFGVFQRLHKMNEFEGTGVGLALVKRIIQRHGGNVGADGKVEEGATFYYTLPIIKTK